MKTNIELNHARAREAAKHERAGRLIGVDLRENPQTQIAVKTGGTVDLLGKRFELFRPPQCLRTVSGPDSVSGSCDTKENVLDSSLVRGCISEREDDPFLYDVAAVATELHGHGYVDGSYFLHAPGVTLRAFKSNFIGLTGNFAKASVKDSKFLMLILQRGVFADFDLTGAQIEMLILQANHIDAAGLSIPSSVGHVYFRWISRMTETSFSTDAATAELVVKAWNSAGACEALAKYLLNRSQKPFDPKIFASKAQTVWGVGGSCGPNSASDVCCGLIARRNQLNYRSRLFNAQTILPTVCRSLRSSAANDQRRII